MKSIEFPEQTHKIAEEQDEYETLPAHINAKEGIVTCCIQLSDEEIEKIVKNKCFWHSQLTQLQPMQPILMSVNKPEMLPNEKPKPKSKIIT